METEENTLTLREHLEELRKRLIYGAAAVVITTALSFIFVPRIFEVIKSRAPENVEFIYINVTEGISVYFK
ncbi:MAG: twin-arginine translocase subunit TatC, partial [Chloroflexota bacterium]|nr:twin-arginine translocase subunit TatC [Chloroflexota bacterium]